MLGTEGELRILQEDRRENVRYAADRIRNSFCFYIPGLEDNWIVPPLGMLGHV